MLNWLRNYLNKNQGVILNVDNAIISNDGKHITIKIPHDSFDKYSRDIICKDTSTKYRNPDGTIKKGKGIVWFEKKKKGFSALLNPKDKV